MLWQPLKTHSWWEEINYIYLSLFKKGEKSYNSCTYSLTLRAMKFTVIRGGGIGDL